MGDSRAHEMIVKVTETPIFSAPTLSNIPLSAASHLLDSCGSGRPFLVRSASSLNGGTEFPPEYKWPTDDQQ